MVIPQEFVDLLAKYIDDRYVTPSIAAMYSDRFSYISANLTCNTGGFLRSSNDYHSPSEFEVFILLTSDNKIESLNGVSNLDFSKLEESLKNSLISTLKREIKKRVVTQGGPSSEEDEE